MIYFITDYWLPKLGGMERSIQYLSEGLKQRNTLYLFTGGDAYSVEDNDGMKVIRFSTDTNTPYYQPALSFIEKQEGHQIAHVFGFSFQWPYQQAQFLRELKETCHIPILFKVPTSGDVSKYLDNEFKSSKQCIDRFITLNPQIHHELQQAGIGEDNIVNISNSVPCHFYKPPVPEEKIAARKSLGLPQEGFILCFCGRFIERKRIDVLIKALNHIQEKERPYLALVGYTDHTFGDGFPIENYTDQHILSISPQVNIRPVYHAADGYFTASEAEGMSNAILEALASGLPILAHDIPGHREMVIHGKNGFLFDNEKILEIVEYILRLKYMLEENTLKKFSICSRQMAETKFDTLLLTARYNRIYDALIQEYASFS